MSKEKQLFEMVYNWGKVGVVTDEKCFAFQTALEEAIEEREENRYKNSKAPCLNCWHHHMNDTPHDCSCKAHYNQSLKH